MYKLRSKYNEEFIIDNLIIVHDNWTYVTNYKFATCNGIKNILDRIDYEKYYDEDECLNLGCVSELKTDGSVPMNDDYIPTEDNQIATVKFVKDSIKQTDITNFYNKDEIDNKFDSLNITNFDKTKYDNYKYAIENLLKRISILEKYHMENITFGNIYCNDDPIDNIYYGDLNIITINVFGVLPINILNKDLITITGGLNIDNVEIDGNNLNIYVSNAQIDTNYEIVISKNAIGNNYTKNVEYRYSFNTSNRENKFEYEFKLKAGENEFTLPDDETINTYVNNYTIYGNSLDGEKRTLKLYWIGILNCINGDVVIEKNEEMPLKGFDDFISPNGLGSWSYNETTRTIKFESGDISNYKFVLKEI